MNNKLPKIDKKIGIEYHLEGDILYTKYYST